MVGVLLLGSAALASTWTVEADGTGDFDTVSDALLAAGVGDMVLVGEGTYGPSTGEELPYYFPTGVTLQGVDRELVVLDAEGEPTFGTVYNDGVVLGELTLTGATDTALWTGGAAEENPLGSLRLEGVVVRGNSGDRVGGLWCSRATELHDVLFEDNVTTGDYEHRASALYGRGLEAASGLTIHGSVDDAPLAVNIWPPSGEVLCTIDGLWVTGSAVVLDLCDVSNAVFVGIQADYAAVTLYEGWLENAVVVDVTAEVALAARVRNTIVAHNDAAGIWSDDQAVTNLVYANTGGDWASTDWSGMLGNLSADPLFRDFSDDGDWTNDDLRLSTGSPAIDAACGDYPSTDIDGIPRPQDGDGDGLYRADIGPYEWGLVDEDGDGWYLEGGDCDDTDASVHPGATEFPYDGIDQDCDGVDLVDVDGDGFDADHQGGDDCDDTDEDVHPGAWDIPDDGIDQDCDGQDAHDSDGDGWPDDQDCEPGDPAIHPGAEEICNGIDDDCDGEIDEDACEPEDTGDTSLPVDTGLGDEVRTCGCGCRDRNAPGAAWLLLALPLWLVRRRDVATLRG